MSIGADRHEGLRLFFGKPPGRVITWLAALASAALLWASTYPGTSGWSIALLAAAVPAVAVAWAVKSVTSRVVSGTWSKRVVIVPLLALGTTILLVVDLPMEWRWTISESFFVEVSREQAELADDGTLGMYTVTDVIDGRDATFFDIEGGGDHAGFLYSWRNSPLSGEYDHCPALTVRSLGERHYGWYEFSCG